MYYSVVFTVTIVHADV